VDDGWIHESIKIPGIASAMGKARIDAQVGAVFGHVEIAPDVVSQA
jgi:hypothetical protein